MNQERLQKIKAVAAKRQRGLVVVLEDIHDPHNAAAVLRTCDALGVQQVHFIFTTTAPYNPVTVGKVSSASANQWLDIVIHRSLKDCLRWLRSRRYRVIATALAPGAQSIFTYRFVAPRLALLFGNEHQGLSAAARDAADSVVMIPMQGMVQSLNISVTAALCLYEVTRQRRARRQLKPLLKDEQQALVRRWSLPRRRRR